MAILYRLRDIANCLKKLTVTESTLCDGLEFWQSFDIPETVESWAKM